MLLSLNRGTLSLVALSLLTSCCAAEVFERLAAVPEGWRYSHTPQASQNIKLQVAMAQGNVAGFEQALMDMSTPGHPKYGQHFQTHDEMKRMLQPSDEAVYAVREWLEDAGITDIQQEADWITFNTTVGIANKLLDANFQYYIYNTKHVERLRTLEYSIPDSLLSHVNMVSPTTRFGQIHPNRATIHREIKAENEKFLKTSTLHALVDCDSVINPQCLMDLYNVSGYQASATIGNKIAFFSYLDQIARYPDLNSFEKNIAPRTVGQNFSVVTYNGGLNNQSSTADSSEANLDVQYIVGISYPIPVTEYITGGRAPLVPDLDQPNADSSDNEPYLETLQNLVKLSDKDLPQVLSISYGEDEQSVPAQYAKAVCNYFAQLGSRGVSVIFSSGDSGVGSACMTNDGKNTTHFPPQFPASCPWVTSVGATAQRNPEKAVYFSSGGFSDLWDRPSYQLDAVNEYLKTLGDKWSGLFNPKGRGFPDVAAQGQNYMIYNRGQLIMVDGTSASAPTFAGIIALLNDARIKDKQSPLGFLNPWLYSAGSSALNDITVGGSTGCDGKSRFSGDKNGSPVVPYASWNATKGWDPVSGLGTPDFGKMLESVKTVNVSSSA